MNKNVALIFGGCTPEHEVSIVTAHQVCSALQENHHVIPIYVTKNAEWLTGRRASRPVHLRRWQFATSSGLRQSQR